ncbi:MAG: reprolysin-like metallopeptidase [Bacteroidota bacterium]
MKKFIYTVLSLLLLQLSLNAQNDPLWRHLTAAEKQGQTTENFTFVLNEKALIGQLQSYAKSTGNLYLSLPLSDKKTVDLRLESNQIMEAPLAAKYPNIKTYNLNSKDGKTLTGKMVWSHKGLNATLYSQNEIYMLSSKGNQRGEVVYEVEKASQKKIARKAFGRLNCGAHDEDHDPMDRQIQGELLRLAQDLKATEKSNDQLTLKKYRLAMATTGEYGQYHGGTKESVMAALTVLVSQANMATERDLGIQFVLVADNDKVIFTVPQLDPFDDVDNGLDVDLLMEQNTNALNVNIGFQNYDVGHVVGVNTAVSGIAFLRSICTTNKARGVTTADVPEGLGFAAILAHELGHQMGANHSFSSCHNVFSPTAYEPGGGTTIMSYAGICSNPTNNLQQEADLYYHTISLEEITIFTLLGDGRLCAQEEAIENTIPEVSINKASGFHIPISTPFKLEADANDADGDSLTYCWEQFDRGPINVLPGQPTGNVPLFRSLPPEENPTRFFPELDRVIRNRTDRSEVLPDYSRDLTFRCTVRDNHPNAGATAMAEIAFRSTDTAGPFLVTAPNDGTESWEAGSFQPITWDVANTNGGLVDCQYVNILLSVDGGETYPYTLAVNTPNDGLANVSIPNIETGTARIMVEAADNIFYDLSNRDFDITPASQASFYLDVTPTAVPQLCLPSPATFTIKYSGLGGFDETLRFELLGDLPEEAIYSFSSETITPTEAEQEVTLNIDLNAFVNDQFELQVAIISSQDTTYREIQFTTASNDFSSLALNSPSDQAINQAFVQTFEWTGASDAENYDFELATSPAFGEDDIVIASYGTFNTNFAYDELLDANTVYYWRVRPNNQCGSGDFLTANVFRTRSVRCESYESTDTPINISGTGLPTVTSTISVPSGGSIEDVNIPIINVNYQPIKSLRLSLVGPNDKEAILYDQNCGNTLLFRSGFDDEAARDIYCPPDDSEPLKPIDSLEMFIGDIAAGDWQLKVQVVEGGFGSAGGFNNWAIEFCSEFEPMAPAITINDTMPLPYGVQRSINNTFLSTVDADYTAEQLVYDVIQVPQHGNLIVNGVIFTTGGSFTQADINNGLVTYANDGDTSIVADQFVFNLRNADAGWLLDQTFNIALTTGPVTSTEELLPEGSLTVFPNPANDAVNVSLQNIDDKNARLILFDAIGRILATQVVEDGINTQFDLTGNPSGLYMIQLQTQKGSITKKLIIE